jgi:hypothetical protein
MDMAPRATRLALSQWRVEVFDLRYIGYKARYGLMRAVRRLLRIASSHPWAPPGPRGGVLSHTQDYYVR